MNGYFFPFDPSCSSVIVWGARSLSFRGLHKDSIDAQIACSIDCSGYQGSQDLQQTTDVHYFSRNGNAIFNWRVVYSKIRLPVSSCVLQISAFDFRTLGPSVFVGEVKKSLTPTKQLSKNRNSSYIQLLRSFLHRASLLQVNVELRSYLEKVGQSLASREYDAEFRLMNRKYQKADQIPGYVQTTIQIIAQQEANTKQAGLGRESPNRDPRLTTPLDGRKWEDFLKSSGLRRDFSPLMFKVSHLLSLSSMMPISIISVNTFSARRFLNYNGHEYKPNIIFLATIRFG